MRTSGCEATMLIRLRWFDPAANAVRDEQIDAPSHEAAVARVLAGAGVFLSSEVIVHGDDQSSAQSGGQAPGWRRALLRGTPPAAARKLDVAGWCRELRVLLRAGMTVVEAIEALRAQGDGPSATPAHHALHEALHRALQQGQRLSAAMASAGGFPAVLLASVQASERTGALPEALDDYLRYHEMIEGLRRKLVSAAIYPALVLTLGAVIVLFLLLFVVPRFSAMTTDMRGSLSGATGALMAVSQWLVQHTPGLAAVGLIGVLALMWGWRRGWALVGLARLAQALGPVRRRLDEFRLAKLYQALALMYRGGCALDEALLRCAALGLGPRFSQAALAAQQALLQGVRLSDALSQAGLADAVGERLLRVGERSGNFDQVLQTIAERHAERFATIIERATRLAEPILLMLVALVVGGVVVLMYMPVFDIAGSLG